MSALEDFIAAGTAFRTRAELLAALRAALRELGLEEVDCYGVAEIRSSGALEPVFITSTLDPIMSNAYLERRSWREDPAVVMAMRRVGPFYYDEMFAQPPTEEVRRMEAAFGPRDGIVVPLHRPAGRLAVICAGAAGAPGRLRAEGWRLLAAVQHLAALADDRAQMIAEGGRRGMQAPRLTPRERECLIRVADGKSSTEIGRALGVSERTVKKHVHSAMDKLEVRTRAQAVAKAMAAGLITT